MPTGQRDEGPFHEDEAGVFEKELDDADGKAEGVMMAGAAVVDGIALGFGWNHFKAFCLVFSMSSLICFFFWFVIHCAEPRCRC